MLDMEIEFLSSTLESDSDEFFQILSLEASRGSIYFVVHSKLFFSDFGTSTFEEIISDFPLEFWTRGKLSPKVVKLIFVFLTAFPFVRRKSHFMSFFLPLYRS
jgi:hypothetical protein